jgi:UrcA family protein
MFNKTTSLITVLVAGVLSVGVAGANDHKVTVAVPVNAQGLDLSQPADAQAFYARLQQAAYVVCTHGNRVDLVPADNEKTCYEKALGNAIRAAKQPMLTQLFLQSHTLQEALARGIQVPAEVAAK